MSAPKRTVMVVDDQLSIAEAVAEILEWEGFRVLIRENGKTGLEAALAENPSLILLDFMMPVMDGLHMLRELRNTVVGAQMPVVMMSAALPHGLPGMRLATDTLSKPFELDALLAVVRRHVRAPHN